jgi:hypothetical protein
VAVASARTGLTVWCFTLEWPVYAAGIAQLVEHNLAKVGVASSSLVSRSSFPGLDSFEAFLSISKATWTPFLAGWQSGHAAACKAVNAGSIPTLAFINPIPAGVVEWYTHRT